MVKGNQEKSKPHAVSTIKRQADLYTPLVLHAVYLSVQILQEVKKILQPWPHLLTLFTEFLTMEDCIQADMVCLELSVLC